MYICFIQYIAMNIYKIKLVDTKGVIKNSKSKNRQHGQKKKRKKRHIIIIKTKANL
jgi:hypothetical protein